MARCGRGTLGAQARSTTDATASQTEATRTSERSGRKETISLPYRPLDRPGCVRCHRRAARYLGDVARALQHGVAQGERSESTSGESDARARRDRTDRGGATETVAAPTAPKAGSSGAPAPAVEHFVASHDILFAGSPERRCDACNRPLETNAETDDDGYAVPGEGVYLWARGDEVRFEKAPLCPSCAAAIGMTALARWEIEEEEG